MAGVYYKLLCRNNVQDSSKIKAMVFSAVWHLKCLACSQEGLCPTECETAPSQKVLSSSFHQRLVDHHLLLHLKCCLSRNISPQDLHIHNKMCVMTTWDTCHFTLTTEAGVTSVQRECQGEIVRSAKCFCEECPPAVLCCISPEI